MKEDEQYEHYEQYESNDHDDHNDYYEYYGKNYVMSSSISSSLGLALLLAL